MKELRVRERIARKREEGKAEYFRKYPYAKEYMKEKDEKVADSVTAEKKKIVGAARTSKDDTEKVEDKKESQDDV